jgi:hypothetical protein
MGLKTNLDLGNNREGREFSSCRFGSFVECGFSRRHFQSVPQWPKPFAPGHWFGTIGTRALPELDTSSKLLHG